MNRLARFGANICDAHSCFIFLPQTVLNPRDENGSTLSLAGAHSLSQHIARDCRIQNGVGLIGWVAQQKRSIHISPFENDSRTLGAYSHDCELKSIIAHPISILDPRHTNKEHLAVFLVDSKKSFAFSKLQEKHIISLSDQIAESVSLQLASLTTEQENTWQKFLQDATATVHSLGRQSTSIIRLRITNFSELEHQEGITQCVEHSTQFFRLVQQSLPEKFARFQLHNGDLLIVVDNMMTSFYQNRIKALADHIKTSSVKLDVEFKQEAVFNKAHPQRHLEDALLSSSFENSNSPKEGGLIYEYRRA